MTFPIYGAKPTPAVIMDAFGNWELLECADAMSFEKEIRPRQWPWAAWSLPRNTG